MSSSGLDNAKRLVSSYKQSQTPLMTPELWRAKKVVDSTLHPGGLSPCPSCRPETNVVVSTDTGEPVFLPFRMSCFVVSNLVVTAGMLTPGLQVGHASPDGVGPH